MGMGPTTAQQDRLTMSMIGRRWYMHAGARVRGLRRDPVSYLKNPAGLVYTDVGGDYHASVRERMGFQEHGIELSDAAILQCLTHKSFAHGSCPYNEKLNLLGSQYLKLQAAMHSVGPENSFGNLGSPVSKGLVSYQTAAEYVIAKNLEPLVFWKVSDPLNDGPIKGKSKVMSTVLNSFIGAILLQQGEKKASQFIVEDLLNPSNTQSLLNITLRKLDQQKETVHSN